MPTTHTLSDSENEGVVYMPKRSLPGSKPDVSALFSKERQYTNADLAEVVALLNNNGILCFLSGYPAMIYYGVGLIRMMLCIFVVSSNLHEKAIPFFSDPKFVSYGINRIWAGEGPSYAYPEYGLTNCNLRILLVPDIAFGMSCVLSNIHLDKKTAIPYPTLPHFVQSALRTHSIDQLENLVDGQDLDMEWGLKHLNFGRHSWKFATWKKSVEEKRKSISRELPQHLYLTRYVATKEFQDEVRRELELED